MAKEKEAERLKEAEGTKKKPTEEQDGKLVKESEAEAEAKKAKKEAEGEACNKSKEDEDDEDLSDMDDTEKTKYKELRAKVKRKMKKGEGHAVNPEESGAQSTTDGHTTTPGPVIQTPQNILVPPSDVEGKRTQETPMGKSLDNVDLTKSPLYMGVQKKIEDTQKELTNRMGALEKSLNDRLSNLSAVVAKAEEFYEKSFMKAYDTEAGNDKLPAKAQGLEQKIEAGQARFST